MRKTDLVRYFALALLGTCLLGCKLDREDKDVIVKVNPEIQLDMFEELAEVRKFHLLFKTIEPQSCTTNTFNYTANRIGQKLFLNLYEIVEAENCTTGPGMVEGQTSFAYLPLGTYELELNLKNALTAMGELKVTEEKYELQIEEGLGFEMVQETINRIPASTFWGYVAFKESTHAAAAQEFLNEMKSKAEPVSLLQGDFNYFQVDDTARLWLGNAPDYANFKTFYYKLSGDKADLEALLANYRSQYPAGIMEFKVFTWLGETL